MGRGYLGQETQYENIAMHWVIEEVIYISKAEGSELGVMTEVDYSNLFSRCLYAYIGSTYPCRTRETMVSCEYRDAAVVPLNP